MTVVLEIIVGLYLFLSAFKVGENLSGNPLEAAPILKLIEKRIGKKLGCTILVTGDPGKGKSYLCLRLAQLWYKYWFGKEFPIIHVCETLVQAIELVQTFKEPGHIIIVEELGALAGKRDALSTENKVWNKFLETVRVKQCIILANVPHINFVDSNTYLLSQMWIEAMGVNFRNKSVVGKVYQLQMFQGANEPYKYKLVNEEGDALDFIRFYKPDEELCKAYEELKQRNTDTLFNSYLDKLIAKRDKEIEKKQAMAKLSKREQQAYDYAEQGVPAKVAYEEMGLSHVNTYYEYLQNAKKKGYIPNIPKNPKKNKEIKEKS